MTAGRVCGSCSECCFALGVHEMNKDLFVACPHVRKSDHGCCGIYGERPTSCREFTCVWLDGNFQDRHRPDRIGFVLASADLEKDFVIVIAYVSREGAENEPAGQELLSLVAQQIPVCVFRMDGTKSLMVAEGHRHLIPKIRAGINARGVVGEDGRLHPLPLVE